MKGFRLVKNEIDPQALVESSVTTQSCWAEVNHSLSQIPSAEYNSTYEGSESNTLYCIMLAHNIRGRCWW